MIVAGEMLNISERNKGGSHIICPEQLVLDAALAGKTEITYIERPQIDQIDFLRAGYDLTTNTDKGKLVTTISWKAAHDVKD